MRWNFGRQPPAIVSAGGFHLALIGAYALLAIGHTYPLIWRLTTHLPGQGLGDNVSFVWNFWWMRQAIASPEYQFFTCPLIFAPIGASIALHTHTALTAWLAATILSPLSVVTAQNVVLMGSLVLNGLSAHLLTRVVTGSRWAAVFAGALFLVAPSVTGRLMGHYNLVVVWPLIFACASFVMFWRTPTWKMAVLAGLCAGLVPYADYYQAVYFGLFAAAFVLTQVVSLGVNVGPNRFKRLGHVALAAAAVGILVALLIARLPGDELLIAGVTVRTRTPTNALTAAWLFAAIGVLTRWRFSIRAEWTSGLSPIEAARTLLRPALIAIVLVSPLITATWRVWVSGDYVTQASSLKSSPDGVDLATALIGPPYSGLVGDRVRAVYGRFRIDPMESSAWLGVIVIALLASRMRTSWRDRELRRWICIGAVFALWALGPYLTVLGSNTGLILPQALGHFVPVLNNARIPGRAIVVVELCSAILVAMALAAWVRERRRVLTGLVLCAAVVERFAAPLPLMRLPDAGVYREIQLHADARAVLMLPFGLRDGFGERGVFEHDALYGQTVHGHPLVGGFVARASQRVWTWYASTEPYATLLKLSERQNVRELPDCAMVKAGLDRASVGYIVLYRTNASPQLVSFVRANMPIAQLSTDGLRTLFEVSADCPHTQ